jgi:hypothetical protein
MAKYSDIKGFTVQTLSTDPIDSTPPTGAWSSGGSLNDAKPYGFGCGGVKTAAVAFGGGLATDTTNESYDGTSWTENPAMSNGYSYAFGTGTGTDAIAIGGLTTPPLSIKNTTEEWNGSSWTSGGNLNTARYNAENMAFGPGTAAAFVGGKGPDYQPKMLHEQYNGSSWTETTDTPTDLIGGASVGIQTNAVVASGSHSKQPPGSTTSDGKTMAWDGSSWTEITAFSTARYSAFATGVYNDFILVGGANPSSSVQALTEKWDGSSWTEIGDLATGRNSLGGGKRESDSTSAVVFGGSPGPVAGGTVTEEFSVAPPTAQIKIEGQLYFNSTTNTFKETLIDLAGATWSSGGSMNNARRSLFGAGLQTAAIVAGGYTTTNVAVTEQYDGSAWTEVNDLNSARFGGRGIGIYTAALVVGGANPVPSLGDKVEQWDGTNWTEIAEINTARSQFGGVSSNGTTTAGLVAGGSTAGTANTEVWDGSAWTEVNNLNTAGGQGSSGLGTSTAGLAAARHPYASPQACEQWDGTSWSEVAELNTPRGEDSGGNGPSTDGLVYGGYFNPPASNKANTEFWNGSSWTELADLSSGRYALTGCGLNSSSALATGGYTTSNQSQSEEWTASLGNKTITAS